MFTGIIKDVGTVVSFEKNKLKISTKLSGLEIGDSISVNGVCLTIENINKNVIETHISEETKNKTTFRFIKIDDKVNLEPPLKFGEKVSGHLLTGHVDTITTITNIKKLQGSYIYTFKLPEDGKKLIAKKGSIAIDGISLTVLDVKNFYFTVTIIPFTYLNTNLKYKKLNSVVNLEFDILAKYIYNIVSK